MYEKLHWFYPLAVTVGYAAAGTYSLVLNRWLNFQSHGSISTQGGRYVVGLVSQYVIFILGLSSVLHLAGVNAELARVISACCEGVYLYALMRLHPAVFFCPSACFWSLQPQAPIADCIDWIC